MLRPDLRRPLWRALLGLALSQPALAEPTFRLVAMTGQPAPDAGSLADFATFTAPRIDSAGRTAFVATIEGAVLSGGDTGIWAENASYALSQLAREDLEAPGTGGDLYGTFQHLVRAGDGTVYFATTLSGAHGTGIFAGGAGPTTGIALADEPAPGLPAGYAIASFGGIAASAGSVAFRAVLDGPTAFTEYAVYIASGGQTAVVARTGDPAPSTILEFDVLGDPRISSDERVGFFARTEFSASGTGGIWAEGPSGIEAIVREREPAPGLPGVTLEMFAPPSFNSAGDVAFTATLGGTGVTTDNDSSLWSGPRHGFALLAREGQIAPGTGNPFLFLLSHALDDRGHVTLMAALDSGSPGVEDAGIWVGSPGDLDLVVRLGDLAPGTNGASFADNPAGGAFEQLTVAPDGDFAFSSLLFGGDTTGSNARGVWRTVDGELELVVRTGDIVELAPGVFETVSGAELWRGIGATSGLAANMNARDQLAMKLFLQGGGEAVVVVPEPGAALLALAALGALGARARRRARRDGDSIALGRDGKRTARGTTSPRSRPSPPRSAP